MRVVQNHVGGDDGRERGALPAVQVNVQIITFQTSYSSSPHAAGATDSDEKSTSPDKLVKQLNYSCVCLSSRLVLCHILVRVTYFKQGV